MLTYHQFSTISLALRNVRQAIETEQMAPLDIDQATVIYDLCMSLNIDPLFVLGQQALSLIEPDHPLVESLDQQPALLDELGRMLTIGG